MSEELRHELALLNERLEKTGDAYRAEARAKRLKKSYRTARGKS